MNLNSQHSAQRLGYLGLLPFLALAMGGLLDIYGEQAITLFIQYSAIILGFLGGVHWGMAMRTGEAESRRLGWGVVPALIGFTALVLSYWLSELVILSILALMHLFWLNYEKRHLGHLLWYLELRSRLTFTAVALHIILIIISI
ncbi:hypothetical protein IDSA_01570 [Pseudidiomarina salinarum]|uniref:DUF3429 domain-containing protein n=1 Tax=Pseudidiomarina salinarum TaxID=435908 RepID=A0A094IWF8_9GAMM|nr:DUF3429 domain-containing protein [Pseudidiomarina salinarum]KFZ31432.1 hypothetical protein IDSA_01570 [Pseudidiomarina salinarum]RUO70808.1 DUF3429 domain-containing protein [Pseudidiomarina salinarum]